MKKTLATLTAILFSIIMTGQTEKPKLEKEGDLIKGTYYFENGTIRHQGYFNKEGKPHGDWKSFNRNGKKIALGQYLNGKKTGKWFFWNDQKLAEVNFDKNDIVSATTWSEKNEVVINLNN